MNPDKMLHRVDVKRNALGSDPSTGLQTRAGLVVVGTSIPVLIEGLSAKTRSTMLGHISGAKYTISWLACSAIKDGDVITNVQPGPRGSIPMGCVGRTFRVSDAVDDTGRLDKPYCTGILAEVVHG